MSYSEFVRLPGWEQRAWLGYFSLRAKDEKESTAKMKQDIKKGRAKGRRGTRRGRRR